jgi:hypothetical protein
MRVRTACNVSTVGDPVQQGFLAFGLQLAESFVRKFIYDVKRVWGRNTATNRAAFQSRSWRAAESYLRITLSRARIYTQLGFLLSRPPHSGIRRELPG